MLTCLDDDRHRSTRTSPLPLWTPSEGRAVPIQLLARVSALASTCQRTLAHPKRALTAPQHGESYDENGSPFSRTVMRSSTTRLRPLRFTRIVSTRTATRSALKAGAPSTCTRGLPRASAHVRRSSEREPLDCRRRNSDLPTRRSTKRTPKMQGRVPIKGVTWHPSAGRFQAQIRSGARAYLGLYDCPVKAGGRISSSQRAFWRLRLLQHRSRSAREAARALASLLRNVEESAPGVLAA